MNLAELQEAFRKAKEKASQLSQELDAFCRVEFRLCIATNTAPDAYARREYMKLDADWAAAKKDEDRLCRQWHEAWTESRELETSRD